MTALMEDTIQDLIEHGEDTERAKILTLIDERIERIKRHGGDFTDPEIRRWIPVKWILVAHELNKLKEEINDGTHTKN